MKLITPLIIAGLVLSSGGCATSVVLSKADPKKYHFSSTKPDVNAVAHPGYYALLPLSVAYDVALLPVYHIVAVAGIVAFSRIKENRSEPNLRPTQKELLPKPEHSDHHRGTK